MFQAVCIEEWRLQTVVKLVVPHASGVHVEQVGSPVNVLSVIVTPLT